MIEVQGLSKQYRKVRAVDNLTFQVKPGVVTGFLGPNGAGKSTTMRMILGLDSPTEGTATIDGQKYREIRQPLRKVGALLEAKAVHPNRSARNHLKWLAQSNGLDTKAVDDALRLVGLSDVSRKKAGGFSLGMGQRLGLAAAMLGDPEILILDEPVNGLDPEGIHWVRSLLQSLAEKGKTILVSSHLLSEMAQTADHLIVIGRGRLIADSPTHDFIKEHSATSVVLRTDEPEAMQNALQEENISFHLDHDVEQRERIVVPDTTTDLIGALAHSVQVPLSELTQKRASLEEAFMQMTGQDVQYHAETPLAGEAAAASDSVDSKNTQNTQQEGA